MAQITPLNLDKLEGDAKRAAMKHVANMLQRPDQLEKIDQYKRRIARKKASVETMLKTAMQSQLDGVRNGLNQLQSGLNDIKEVKQSLDEVDCTYRSLSDLQDRLKNVRAECSRHRQLGAAVENLKHIFTVPETVKKTRDYINDGKFLLAHKCLADLEASRDELLMELHRHTSKTVNDDKKMVYEYFKDVQNLSDALAKQLWIILQRTLVTVRKEPTLIVTVLRIIEREEKADQAILRRQEATNFIPPGRPKRWRDRCFEVLQKVVSDKIEGSQSQSREDEKMWLVKSLELIRQYVVEDLKVVKSLLEPCFPPGYDIVNKYVTMYHLILKEHIQELIHQQLEGNEVVSLLTWLNDYAGPDMMGNPILKIDMATLGPVADETTIIKLRTQYLQTMEKNIQEWMSNSLISDQKDWYNEAEPEQDAEGCYNTPLPVILLQMFEQNLQVAAHINEDLVDSVLHLCSDSMLRFSRDLSRTVRDYKDTHLQDRSELKYYTSYMIANINNCSSLVDFMVKMKSKYSKGDIDESVVEEGHDKFTTLEKTFSSIAREGCTYLLEEVFLDLKKNNQDILTRSWLESDTIVQTICITIDDYCQDFYHLKKKHFDDLLNKAQHKIIVEYVKALTSSSKRISFKNYEERKTAADKLCREADQYQERFTRLCGLDAVAKLSWTIFSNMAEVIKLKDTALLPLEISAMVERFPDARIEQIVNLLQLRGDISKSESRQMILETIGEEEMMKGKPDGVFTSALI